MKPLFSLLFFLLACLASWGIVFAFAATAAQFIGIWKAILTAGSCLACLGLWFWHETKLAKRQ